MTSKEFVTLAEAAYKTKRWQTAFARDFDIPLRTVQRWVREGIPNAIKAEYVRKKLK